MGIMSPFYSHVLRDGNLKNFHAGLFSVRGLDQRAIASSAKRK